MQTVYLISMCLGDESYDFSTANAIAALEGQIFFFFLEFKGLRLNNCGGFF